MDADFSNANLAYVQFNNSYLYDTQLSGANLECADFTGVLSLPMKHLLYAENVKNIKIDLATLNVNKVDAGQLISLKKKMVANYKTYFANFTDDNLHNDFPSLLKELIDLINNATHLLKIVIHTSTIIIGYKKYGLTDAYVMVMNAGRERIISYLSHLKNEKRSDILNALIQNHEQDLLMIFKACVSPNHFFNIEQKIRENKMLILITNMISVSQNASQIEVAQFKFSSG